MNAIMSGETSLEHSEVTSENIKSFRKTLRNTGLVSDITSETSIALDRFGRPVDLVLEEYKKKSIRPRDLLDARKGEIC